MSLETHSIQYDVEIDRNDARKINNTVLLGDYLHQKEQFLSRVPFNVETALGERFNVGISRFEYDIRDGQLWGQDMDEPAIVSFRRGRDYRKEHGNPIDHAREEAEVEGFEKMQQFLLDPKTEVGSMTLSISPPGEKGSSYGHRFHDVLILKQTERGRRYIEARRYASDLSVGEYSSILMPFSEIDVDQNEPAASLLRNPIKIPPIFTPDTLQNYLRGEHKFMNEEKFEIIKKHTQALRDAFATSIFENPDDFSEHEEIYNTILNKADELDGRIEKEGIDVWAKIKPIGTAWEMRQDIADYSKREVREVITGCGVSSGLNSKKQETPMSVADYGKKWEYHRGDCVVCKKKELQVGPCSICKKCEKDFDASEKAAA